MGFLETLTIVFIVLKLTAVIDWSWLYVFSPIFVAVGIYFLIFAAYFVVELRSLKR